MRQYLELLDDVLTNGQHKSDPQGVGSRAVFCREMRFDLSTGFLPIVTTKKVNFKYVLGELLWFLRGDDNWDFLHEHGIPIWDPWGEAREANKYGLDEGHFGRIYGPQWIHWRTTTGGEINQIQRLVDGLKANPDWRRHKVIAWNPEDIDSVTVAPCHGDFKCFVADGVISLNLVQRSGDVFIGIPYNITSYSLLLLMLAQVTGLRPGEFVHYIQDAHIYDNHVEQARLQLSREPRPLPRVKINPEVTNIFEFTFNDFELEAYDPHPFIGAPVGV
jgi:thymidylate synthase